MLKGISKNKLKEEGQKVIEKVQEYRRVIATKTGIKNRAIKEAQKRKIS